jgi:DNA repair protein RadC
MKNKKNLPIREMAESQKPCEKAIEEGMESLSDAELLALILRCGTNDLNVINLAQLILNSHPVYKGLNGLNYLNMTELTKISGIGKVKACQIMALAEVSRRMAREAFKPSLTLGTPEAIADYFMETCRYLTKERIYALFFSAANTFLGKTLLSEGTVNRSMLSPRELFIEALRYDAVGIVLLHNHPSGNPEPSEPDIVFSRRIKELGEELGIFLLDHVILGDKCYCSLSERGLLS